MNTVDEETGLPLLSKSKGNRPFALGIDENGQIVGPYFSNKGQEVPLNGANGEELIARRDALDAIQPGGYMNRPILSCAESKLCSEKGLPRIMRAYESPTDPAWEHGAAYKIRCKNCRPLYHDIPTGPEPER